MKSPSHVQLFATPWTVAYQAPPPMEFFRQEYWSGLPFPSPGDLPDPGIELGSSALQADTLSSEPPGKPKTRDDRYKYQASGYLSGELGRVQLKGALKVFKRYQDCLGFFSTPSFISYKVEIQ